MTTEQTDQPAVEQPPVAIVPGQGSRLEQLHALYADLKEKADAAAAEFRTVSDAIKAELAQQAPGHERVELRGEAGPALRLTYTESWRIDSRKLKAEDPVTYASYAKKSSAWVLKAAGGGR